MAGIGRMKYLSAIFKLLDVRDEGDHPLSCSSDQKLIPDLHLWLDAKSGADSPQTLHRKPSVGIQAAKC